MSPTQALPIEMHVQDPFLEQIRDGSKTVEGRLNRGRYREIAIGDTLCFNQSVLVKVDRVAAYSSFTEMLRAEGFKRAIPNATTIEQAVAVCRGFYSQDDEQNFGVLAICLSVLKA